MSMVRPLDEDPWLRVSLCFNVYSLFHTPGLPLGSGTPALCLVFQMCVLLGVGSEQVEHPFPPLPGQPMDRN